ncbi:MAG TPA: glycosyltransferase family 2 protein [Usitatibacter sp.]|nr:glycosyltransferase family 2 protein [Usitatibacter sp.]
MKDVTATVINFNTAAVTRRCTRSLLAAGITRVLVLDNASARDDYERLREDHAADPGGLRVIRSEENLGFAEGSNRLIAEALADPSCARVLLLNNDAFAEANGLTECLRAMEAGNFDLMGGRMMKPAVAGGTASVVDSLGISMYKPLLASNRMSTEDVYLGPTGGLAVYSRRFLEEVRRLHGYVFDPTYFCYAEDTDLCVRARLLAFTVGYTDAVVAFHEGQASNAGQYNDFILYHGIRNSLWMAAKSIPGRMLLARLPWLLALHAAIVVRHVLQGRARTVFRLYRDALCALPRVLKQRRLVQSTRRIAPGEFRAHIDPKFYESKFLSGALRELFRRPG